MARKQITTRCKAFSGEGVREHNLEVEEDGTIRVYDPVAGHYTLVHSLSPDSQRRIRALAGVVTNEQIEALQIEAGKAGDTRMVETCMRAVDGDDAARRECSRAILEVAA